MKRELQVDVSRAPDRVSLRLVGDLDLSVVSRARTQLDDAERDLDGRELRLDVSGLTFADSTALGLLLDAHQRAERAGSKLVVLLGDGPVGSLLEMAGVRDDFVVVT